MAPVADLAAALRGHFDSDPGVTKIHKLLYYCQGWHLAWVGEPLFPEDIEAWGMGPVVATLWRDEKYRPKAEPQALSEIEARTVEYVAARYGELWANQLVGRTHQEDPWLYAREHGEWTLSLDRMREFFTADPAADQAWFWDAAWQHGEQEADEDIEQGRTEVFDSNESFVDSLRARRADA